MHLIQPVSIEGTKYCFTCQGGRITKGVLTDFDLFGANGAFITSDCGPWQLAEVIAGPGLVGEISFGASCVNSVLVKITPHYDPLTVIQEVEVEIRINNTFLKSVFLGADFIDETIDLTPAACGSVVTFQVRSGTADTLDLEVLSVT